MLRLIKNEGADLLLIAGDLGYDKGYMQWRDQLRDILPENFPVVAALGNHDAGEKDSGTSWSLMNGQIAISDRLSLVESCEGMVGSHTVCSFFGITVVTLAPDVFGYAAVLVLVPFVCCFGMSLS